MLPSNMLQDSAANKVQQHQISFKTEDIINPQIVNGCQTVTNLSIEFENDRNSNRLQNGSVLCKIFTATSNWQSGNFVGRIEFTHSSHDQFGIT